jgi:hypothetical protein
MRGFKIMAAISLAFATTIGAIIVSIAWDHNPMGAYGNPAGGIFEIDWPHTLVLFGSWFVPIFCAGLVFGSIPLLIAKLFPKLPHSAGKPSHKPNGKGLSGE